MQASRLPEYRKEGIKCPVRLYKRCVLFLRFRKEFFQRMSDSGESKYKWTPESTKLLVSVWTDKQVQKQLKYSKKPQLIWESVAKYMNKKGYSVTGKQCRSRMKQVLVCYREAQRAGTRAGVEQYYESIDRVLKLKRLEQAQNSGIDTVDSAVTLKSPPKEIKTNKNLQMRCKYQQPVESVYRTEALSPVWNAGRDEDYPDSPESNETVLVQPFRVFSPVRDAATNTIKYQLGNITKKTFHPHRISEELPIKENYRQNTQNNNYFSEIPFQNTVQNVQNQIIQENMQQNQAILQQNHLENNRLQMNSILRPNIQNNNTLYSEQGLQYNQVQLGIARNLLPENVLQIQNKYHMNSVNNRAVPQEPRKNSVFRHNSASANQYFQDNGFQNFNTNSNQLGLFSPCISPDISPNLNDAFCQSKSDKGHGVNENFTQSTSNPLNVNAEVTTLTNNATFNDDTLSIEFLHDSPSPDNESAKLKDFAVNTDEIPNAPLRKKKAEKLERLMMSAINSQNEVVNKILAAQNDMVSRVLDLDRDRQSRLENRLDHLLDVVQTAVLNKNADKGQELPLLPPELLITNLMPPPKPGVIPPKLDLVPPKPCRVPCTLSNTNSQMNNQKSITTTKPGVISPIMSPSNKIGAIWQKLGPVSTSPFIRAQQQLGLKPVYMDNDVRTQSSTERRIAKEFEMGMDTRTLMVESANFLEAERQIQEEVENARIKSTLGRELQARRRLFTQREPNVDMVLSAAFLEAEIQSTEIIENARLNRIRYRQNDKETLNKPIDTLQYQYPNYQFINAGKCNNDVILAGQGHSYNRLRDLNAGEILIGNPCDSSTPSKLVAPLQKHENIETNEPRQTIQQLAQRVMNSARWRNNATNQSIQRKDLNFRVGSGNVPKSVFPGEDAMIMRNTAKEEAPDNRVQYNNGNDDCVIDGKVKTLNWLEDRYSYDTRRETTRSDPTVQQITKRLSQNELTAKTVPPQCLPMGFTTDLLNMEENKNRNNYRLTTGDKEKRVGFLFNDHIIDENVKNCFGQDEKDPFEELHQFYIQKQLKVAQSRGIPFMIHNGKVILAQNEMIEQIKNIQLENKQTGDTDSDNDEEFLDTTASMPSTRKNSVSSLGSKSGKAESGCIIS